MKKTVITLCILMSFILCACSQNISGYACELTSKIWYAEPSDTAKVSLAFDKVRGFAELSVQSKDLQKKISGKYIADEASFVIFMPEISHNYYFEYKPMGDNLLLTYNGMTLEMKAT